MRLIEAILGGCFLGAMAKNGLRERTPRKQFRSPLGENYPLALKKPKNANELEGRTEVKRLKSGRSNDFGMRDSPRWIV
jgi:hypothetical protein